MKKTSVDLLIELASLAHHLKLMHSERNPQQSVVWSIIIYSFRRIVLDELRPGLVYRGWLLEL